MKVTIALFALLGCALAYPQHATLVGRDFTGLYYQDDAGQLSQSFTGPGISRSDQLVLVPDGKGDYYPVQNVVVRHIAPDGQVVDTNINAGPQGAVITGSHVPKV